jgi:hypothetical protein
VLGIPRADGEIRTPDPFITRERVPATPDNGCTPNGALRRDAQETGVSAGEQASATAWTPGDQIAICREAV